MTMEQKTEKALTLQEYEKKLSTDVLSEIGEQMEHGLMLPRNYVPANAVASFMLALRQTIDKDKRSAISVCSPDSIKQAMLEMLQWGLNVSKRQGYLIVFGNKLVFLTSYFGEVAKAKSADPNIKEVYAEVVYKGDNFKYQIRHGQKVVTTHEQEPENIKNENIVGAYATILYKDGSEMSEYMTIDQIRNSWKRGQTNGQSDAHKLAPEEMSRKTVLRRLCKSIFNTSDDTELMMAEEEAIDQDIDNRQNTKTIDITPDDLEEPTTIDDFEQMAIETFPPPMSEDEAITENAGG